MSRNGSPAVWASIVLIITASLWQSHAVPVLISEKDVRAVLTMDDLIDAMETALVAFSSGTVAQPLRTVLDAGGRGFLGAMPAYMPAPAALGAKLVTVFDTNASVGLPTHLATIVLLDPATGQLAAIIDGRYITEARTAAVSAVSARLLARKTAKSLAIIGSGVQARSHLDALSRVHQLKQVTVWSPQKLHRDQFVEYAKTAGSDPGRSRVGAGSDPGRSGVGAGSDPGRSGVGVGSEPPFSVTAADHPGEAIVGADIVVLVTLSSTPVIESGWVKPGAHIICVGACRPTQREIDPDLTARARLFVDSREAALVESGDVVLGIQEGRFTADHIVAELGELVNGAAGRRSDAEITIFKSLGMAVEDVTAADLAYRRAVERGVGTELAL
jgi:ornithine cyclodeaminase/alanine dehydrogenase-like protein (mu-crystallin family)